MTIRPENYDEIEACIAIVWGEEGRDCHTKLALRNKCEQTIREMREYDRPGKDTHSQQVIRQGRCGKFTDGGKKVCIQDPGHNGGIHDR